MAITKIKALLHQSIGLQTQSIGDASIERAIHKRMLEKDIQVADEYLALLRNSTSEFGELVEEVVVPETWFFRNTSPFDALASYIPRFSASQSSRSSTPLRVLSLPCSTGEEPYSIAMVLLERGLAQSDFSIDAFDVSRRALEKAKKAIYGKNSFREKGQGLRSKYFTEDMGRYHLIDDVRRCVSFSQGNIVNDSLKKYTASYDIIFCRNLLIYFDRKTQSLVLEKLRRALKEGGVLCVGHAESSQVPKKSFQTLDIPMAFAFRKLASSGMGLAPTDSPVIKSDGKNRRETLRSLTEAYKDLAGVIEKDKRINRKVSHKLSTEKKEIRTTNTNNSVKSQSTPAGKSDIKCKAEDACFKDISGFIEMGKLYEASELADCCLRESPESSETHYYLGLIRHLEGSIDVAESLLKKAVYLNPHHHAALGLLALLANGRGDSQQSDMYRRRQQRAIQHSSHEH